MAKFSKAHYQILTKAIRETQEAESECLRNGCDLHVLGELIENLIQVLTLDNPKFNPVRFRLACQPKPEVNR